ncbi:MAG: DNA recombination protein RmuC [Bacteroidia bacterium]|nr:DNA recombination protein RmuC [Bacteroidia bacterium]
MFKSQNELLNNQIQLLQSELNQERELLESKSNSFQEIDKQYSALSADYRNMRERFDELVSNKEKEKERFELLATKILDQKTEQFDKQHKAGIKEVLEPLKEKIKQFETKVESTNKESLDRHLALKYQIQHLTQLNEKMTSEAANLTRALKGDAKTQGNWGELILESILYKSGLEKNREYVIQPSFTYEGKQVRPDVIIHLPDGKKLVIDSKVSLTAYEQFVNAELEEQPQLIKAHLISVRKHIDGLSAKAYHDIYKMESPDFVLMFVPIETAFSLAIREDSNIYQYAFDKNIVIVTPSTLLATLKTVETLWRNEKQQKHALDIASEAGKMYDKFVNLVADLEKLGKQMDTSKLTYQETMKKLSEGRGNLINRADKIKQLGAKTTKKLEKK